MLDERAVGLRVSLATSAAAMFSTEGLPDTSILQVFIGLVKMDGLAVHQVWAKKVLLGFCLGKCCAHELPLFIKEAVKQMPQDELEDLVRQMAQSHAGFHGIGLLLRRLDAIIEGRPELRAKLLAAAGIEGDRWAQLESQFGISYRRVFAG
jgi:hypothetical protein